MIIFFLHHANIDYHWAKWQNDSPGTRLTDYSGNTVQGRNVNNARITDTLRFLNLGTNVQVPPQRQVACQPFDPPASDLHDPPYDSFPANFTPLWRCTLDYIWVLGDWGSGESPLEVLALLPTHRTETLEPGLPCLGVEAENFLG
ncbi:hypothetical protein PCASD_20224 [Puccinia coronata f. sp. avenae]|uniref:Tyrosinase copper-binding domain-containing protein n=1 Tax=Puccinia coronata f. sp. avenae TaxID=200324 RepID=A0A2N5TVZ2_9BASI|nr:hypothetical protein PCASD_20224 [Puccinia coronata f. sp. avenae]